VKTVRGTDARREPIYTLHRVLTVVGRYTLPRQVLAVAVQTVVRLVAR